VTVSPAIGCFSNCASFAAVSARSAFLKYSKDVESVFGEGSRRGTISIDEFVELRNKERRETGDCHRVGATIRRVKCSEQQVVVVDKGCLDPDGLSRGVRSMRPETSRAASGFAKGCGNHEVDTYGISRP
jgi:hypothetical protein